MSSNPKTKDPTEIAFSISFEDDHMPGVTQLLNPTLLKEKAAAAARKNSAPPPPSPSAKPASKPAQPAESVSVSFEDDAVERTTFQKFTPPAKPEAKAPVTSLAHTSTAITPTKVVPPTHASPASAPPAKNTSHASAPVATKAIQADSLTELKVQFELQFEMKNGVFRYSRTKPHAKSGLALWQEKFYYQMKLDFKTLEVHGSFQEFEKTKHPFQSEAFGLNDSSFVQIVRLEGQTDKVFVLLSEQSLAASEQTVRTLLQKGASGGSSGAGDDDFKIELAS